MGHFRPLLLFIFVFSTVNIKYRTADLSGQSYKQFTLVNYDSRVVPDLKALHFTTVGS